MAPGKIYLNLAVLWLPVPVTLFMGFIWYRQTGSRVLTSYAVLVPLCYGYLMPFVAINIMKKWRFRNGIMMGGMYLHHGFMYAWKLSLFGFLPLLLLRTNALDLPAAAAWVAATTFPYAFLAWLEDSLCVTHGFVEFADGPVTGAETGSYAPLCFSCIGFIYSCGLVWSYAWCAAAPSAFRILLVFATVFTALFSIPSLIYRLTEDAKRLATAAKRR